ncbi:bacterial Ig-like domain-containing protein [Actinomyces sp. zg-332]|uniref:bacterial Ig-like domain-containing protein n=1 Tax=Actinomyces sp. zg-332 TaxID=2708340 RepID=UPI0018C1D548|nr:bacterial Ig-like domain-containing protein [Actinomyces sp. zg-332]QPK94344.1 bacterial Ig-like domain-containing protein [Actinomyces sp. zg-332]
MFKMKYNIENTKSRTLYFFLAFTLLILGFQTPTFAQTADNPVVINGNDQNVNTQGVVSNDGYKRTIYYEVVGKDGKTYRTNAAGLDGIGRSLIDLSNMQSLSMVFELENTSSSPITVSDLYYLPGRYPTQANKSYPAQIQMAGEMIFSDPNSDIATNSTYNGKQANEVGPGKAVEYSNVEQVHFIGKAPIPPGTKLTARLPLKLINADKMKMTDGHYFSIINLVFGSAKGPNVAIDIRFTQAVKDKSGNPILSNKGQYIGTVMTEPGAKKYSAVPADIQKVLPHQDLSDYTIANDFFCAEKFFKKCTLPWTDATTDPTLYQGGFYRIKLERIRASLEGTGYTTNGLPYYTYTTREGAELTDANGNPIPRETTDSNGNTLGTLYVELFQYIKAHDTELTVGDKYTPADTLDSIHEYNVKTPTSVDLTDPRVSIDSNVDTSKPGIYKVRYTFKQNDFTVATKDVKVVVKSKEQAAKTESKDKNDNKQALKPVLKKKSSPLAETGLNSYALSMVGLAAIPGVAIILISRRSKKTM